MLRPGVAGPREDIDRAGLWNRVVVLVAVDADSSTRFPRRGDGERVAVAAEREAETEHVAAAAVRRFDVSLLRPGVAAANIDVHRAGVIERVVVLVAVDAAGGAALVRRADRHRRPVTAHGKRVADVPGQRAAAREVIGAFGVRGFEIRQLADGRDALGFLPGTCRDGGGDRRRGAAEE